MCGSGRLEKYIGFRWLNRSQGALRITTHTRKTVYEKFQQIRYFGRYLVKSKNSSKKWLRFDFKAWSRFFLQIVRISVLTWFGWSRVGWKYKSIEQWSFVQSINWNQSIWFCPEKLWSIYFSSKFLPFPLYLALNVTYLSVLYLSVSCGSL